MSLMDLLKKRRSTAERTGGAEGAGDGDREGHGLPGTTATATATAGASQREDRPGATPAGDSTGTATGRKRAGGTGSQPSEVNKRPRQDEQQPDDDTPGGQHKLLLSVDLGARQKARVRERGGQRYVDLREYVEKDDMDVPTRKGISLEAVQWARLARGLPPLLDDLRGRRASTQPVRLSNTRRAEVLESRGDFLLDVREHYRLGEGMAPTPKGLQLRAPAAEALMLACEDISRAAGAPAAPPPLPETQQVAARPGKELVLVELGAYKRLFVGRFRGRPFVGLRQYHYKDGLLYPGKTGIALTPSNWAKLSAALGEVTDALSRQDLDYVLPLSRTRRVSLSESSSEFHVQVRELLRDRQGNPGRQEQGGGDKGLDLNARQWAVLVAAAPAVDAALQQLEEEEEGGEAQQQGRRRRSSHSSGDGRGEL